MSPRCPLPCLCLWHMGQTSDFGDSAKERVLDNRDQWSHAVRAELREGGTKACPIDQPRGQRADHSKGMREKQLAAGGTEHPGSCADRTSIRELSAIQWP